MTCTHQWHDATTKAGPEWACAKCKVTYTETKKTLSAPKRGWVGLTDEERKKIALEVPKDAVCITEAKLKEKNT